MEVTNLRRISFSSVFVGGIFLLAVLCDAITPHSKCPRKTSLVGFSSDFRMVQHQLRGVISIIDGCSFKVTEFDMIEGVDVHWWGAQGDSFHNLTNGFVVSEQRLNRTFKNDSLIVPLLKNYTWDDFKVVGVWDSATASDFGHVFLGSVNVSDALGNATNGSGTLNDTSPELNPNPIFNESTTLNGKPTRNVSEPVMFDNCIQLNPNYRLRWSVDISSGMLDIGLEAAVSERNYMAFGWAKPKSSRGFMLHADVAVAGFSSDGVPFADDYYITKYSECVITKDGPPVGVCPDFLYAKNESGNSSSNIKLVYSQRLDGVSLIRYRRPLHSADDKYDVSVNPTENMTVIWAVGLIKPPDSLQPFYLPQTHGGSPGVTYGHRVLNISENTKQCLGPLEAESRDDSPVIFADGQTPLIVTADTAIHYPNPPNPSKVIYVNKKEAPVLRIERGVPVTFSIQAGHDVAFCITSDPIGGAASRNESQDLYIGGEEAHGVPAKPLEITWKPDRKTPDQLYYQSFFEMKMGWKVEVVDGGLSDMYNNSVLLDDQQVTLFWTLSEHSISIAVRGEHKSNYVAIGFGSRMVNTFAYVGWVDSAGNGYVDTYWIDGQDASSIHPTKENLTDTIISFEKNIITFEFTRPLNPKCSGRIECKNVIDPSSPLKIVWATGAHWTDGSLSEKNMHSKTSNKAVIVHLLRGAAEADQALQPVLVVHGFMMFLAWGILLPGGVLAARYLKHLKGDGWFQIHIYLQYSGIAVMLLGLLFAAAELRGFHTESLHVKFGIIAIMLACGQVFNACLRPKKPLPGEQPSPRRTQWEYLHVISGRSAIAIGFISLLTGLRQLGKQYGNEHVTGINWALILWFLAGSVAVGLVELRNYRKHESSRHLSKSDWVMGNSEDDDSVDLLQSTNNFPYSERDRKSHSSQVMEVQLEPMH